MAVKLNKTLLARDRVFYYYQTLICSVEFLKKEPGGKELTELYLCLLEALKLTGEEWNPDRMYTDLCGFYQAIKPGEKSIYFIHKIIKSGLHEHSEIVSIINLFIKLINIFDLRKKLLVDLPQKKNLHDISYVIPEFKY